MIFSEQYNQLLYQPILACLYVHYPRLHDNQELYNLDQYILGKREADELVVILALCYHCRGLIIGSRTWMRPVKMGLLTKIIYSLGSLLSISRSCKLIAMLGRKSLRILLVTDQLYLFGWEVVSDFVPISFYIYFNQLTYQK